MNLKCEKCNKGFSIGISSKGGSITFMGGISAQCPFCGHINKTPGGKFEFDKNGNIIKAFLLESNIPENDLLKFIDIVKEYINTNKYDQIGFQNEITSINPKLQKLVSLVTIKSSGDFFALLTLLVTLILGILSTKESPTVINNTTINNVTYQDTSKTKVQNKEPAKKKNMKKKKARK